MGSFFFAILAVGFRINETADLVPDRGELCHFLARDALDEGVLRSGSDLWIGPGEEDPPKSQTAGRRGWDILGLALPIVLALGYVTFAAAGISLTGVSAVDSAGANRRVLVGARLQAHLAWEILAAGLDSHPGFVGRPKSALGRCSS